MNYLAHAYLSFGLPEILVGNMISDFIKGRQKLDYTLQVQKGIELHREIDRFTDSHPVTLEAKQLFKPVYGLYAGAFMDIVYDHFLALDDHLFTEQQLLTFSRDTYEVLDGFSSIFPHRFSRMFPYMKQQNWLYNYRFVQGIFNSFGGLVYRAKYMNDSRAAEAVFEKHYHSFYNYYLNFFPDIAAFVQQFLLKNNLEIRQS